jgi:hypothetical protein
MKPALPKLRRFADKVIDVYASEVQSFLTSVLGRDVLWGSLITVTLQAGTPTAIVHGLSGPAKGYIVVRRSLPHHVYDAPSDGDLNKLWVKSDADVTVTLYVF